MISVPRRDFGRLALVLPAGFLTACGASESKPQGAPTPNSTPNSAPNSAPTSSERNADVLVIGAGIAGLRAAEVLERLAGRPPVGMRTASWDFSVNTLRIIREMGLLYDSSLMGDDDPYELTADGEPTGIVELPPEWIRDDAVYFNMHRFSALRPYTPPSAVEEIFRGEFDGAWEEGGVFLLTMHPHHIGHRSRLPLLDRLVQHMKARGGCWFCTHEQLARWCKAHAA